MGLGKTIQIAAYLNGMYEAENISRVLIVCPATVKTYWENELNKWCSIAPRIMQFDEKKKSERYE